MAQQIPDKLYFKIGEVATLTSVKPYVLRYWESEFKIISPKKSLTRQRVYSRGDVDLILEIKRLLYKEKYTLEGAKKRIRQIQKEAKAKNQLGITFPDDKYSKAIKSITRELKSLKKILAD